ncbi:flagellar motor protein [candidate division GN15 bacterium]|nr:flagellar motor protein [candidate division GN15 bacterium]
MDFATILGMILAVAAIGGAYHLEGGQFGTIFLAAPMLIVIGGTLGATVVTTSMDTVRQVPGYLRRAMTGGSYRFTDTIERIVRLAEKARREGILGLENDLRREKDPFLRKALQLVVDGTDVGTLRDILEIESAYAAERQKKGIYFFRKAGGFSPTMGILGTVLGLVHTLSNTGDASRMATAIAAAFIATLWGVGLANVFFLPVSDKLRLRLDEEAAHLELITEGAVAIQSGENPRNIRRRLLSFIEPIERKESD